MLITASAITFAALTGIVIIFQGCLAAGVPWGKASMGGKFPGKYPPKMRLVAVANMFILGFFAAIVLSEDDILFPGLKAVSGIVIWIIVVFFIVATILNTITPSRIERIWAPVALLQLITSLIVALD
ncbi:MAG: hypothetical protein KDC05_12665 [Bacteroidales bacterium]|nr:hypothetical protein [Bacteroidales bacterium]